MSLKSLIIIFLILALVPVFMSKVALPPFADFFKSWESFKTSFTHLLGADYNYYKSLVIPWIEKAINILKEKIKGSF